MSTEVPEILLAHYLKILKLPTFQREYQKLARLSIGVVTGPLIGSQKGPLPLVASGQRA